MQTKKNNSCSGCGKPVFFAERKTSLGKDWHPGCLKCKECGKVLSPGQHAERKGIPYCHNPCYSQLFGPQMFGYGSNVASPANFKKLSNAGNHIHNSSFNEDSQDGLKLIFKTTNSSPAPIRLHVSQSPDKAQKPLQNRMSTGSFDSRLDSGYSSINSGLDTIDAPEVSGLNCVYQSNTVQPKCTPVVGAPTDLQRLLLSKDIKSHKIGGAELFKRVQSYNEHHQNKRGQTLSIVEDEGNVRVQGSLPIYWGLHKPIILKQYDDVPSVPTPKKRFSVITDNRESQELPESVHDSATDDDAKSHRMLGSTGFDDSVLSLSSPDVVMRRPHIKKSNTVAYRGDGGNKWKRASINGHIYNYDTSVFTPVFGSCTSVTVNNKMTVLQVISTLLEKFKVENEASEYNLYIVTEKEGERLLKETDIPLLERLALGPTDSVKIFIRDRANKSPTVNSAHIPDCSSPTSENPVEEMHLPEEVEQLLNIPEPVLQGLLEKFHRDEEIAVKTLKAKYERTRKKVKQIIDDKKAKHK